MAIIGVYDADMVKYTHVPFNLDLMKLAAYHKKHYDIVTPITRLDLDKYSKVIYRKDYYDGTFDSEILLNDKVEYGGRAFSPEKHIYLGEEVESMVADRYIYEIFRPIYCDCATNAQIYQKLMMAQHLRLSPQGEVLWDNWKKQIDTSIKTNWFIFHDYDVGSIHKTTEVLDWIYKELPGKQKKYIGSKFPIQIYDDDSLIQWSQFYPMEFFYNLSINGLRSDEAMYQLIQLQKNRKVSAQSFYNITYGMKTEEEFIQILPTVYRQLIFFRMNRINLRLIYDDTIFSNPEWKEVLRLVQMYVRQASTMKKAWFEKLYRFDSLLSFVNSFRENKHYVFKNLNLSKGEARDIFQFVREHSYELFRLFYECHTVELKGGKFVNG